MPGFTTHYLFGLSAYRKSQNLTLKRNLRKNRAAYGAGLQGPDLFFYFLPSYALHKANLGAITHSQNTGAFLRHLLASRRMFGDAQDRRIAEAYAAGFIGHYILDTNCHPYIYFQTGYDVSARPSASYHGRHMGLETAIDAELLRLYKRRNPSAFRQDATISLSARQKRVVASVLHYAYRKTFPLLLSSYPLMRVSIRSFQFGIRRLHDASGWKKPLLRRLESLCPGYPLLSSLIPGRNTEYEDPLNLSHARWTHPWDGSISSRQSFPDLMACAQKSFSEALDDAAQLFSAEIRTPKERQLFERLLRRLGDKSYLSGLPLT